MTSAAAASPTRRQILVGGGVDCFQSAAAGFTLLNGGSVGSN